jgi:hypothetical protein
MKDRKLTATTRLAHVHRAKGLRLEYPGTS